MMAEIKNKTKSGCTNLKLFQKLNTKSLSGPV